MKYDILADWQLNIYCNFSCPYCFWNKDQRLKDKKYLGNKNIEKIINFFDKSNLVWLIHMSGGEPFMHPRFIEMCQGLTRKHYISINSNLTSNIVYDFIKQIDPKRVAFINNALHYDERLKKHSIELYLDKYNKLKKAGFNVYVTQVFYPELIPNFDEIFNFFKEKNIIVRPKVFRGLFKNKLYPQSYTKEEKEIFNKYSLLSSSIDSSLPIQIDPNLDREFLDGNLSFKGIKCDAGRKFVFIKFNGDIVRCHAANKILGNIFKGKMELDKEAKICPFGICPCPYYGLKYAYEKPKTIKNDYSSYLRQALKKNFRLIFKNSAVGKEIESWVKSRIFNS